MCKIHEASHAQLLRERWKTFIPAWKRTSDGARITRQRAGRKIAGSTPSIIACSRRRSYLCSASQSGFMIRFVTESVAPEPRLEFRHAAPAATSKLYLTDITYCLRERGGTRNGSVYIFRQCLLANQSHVLKNARHALRRVVSGLSFQRYCFLPESHQSSREPLGIVQPRA